MPRTPRMLKIAGPLTPGTRIPKPPAWRARHKYERFYNTDGYSPGHAFEAIVPDDEFHRGLIVDEAVMLVERLTSKQVQEMQNAAEVAASEAALAFRKDGEAKAAANAVRLEKRKAALKKALADKPAVPDKPTPKKGSK